jgi:site-specific recombinase XerD
MRSRQLAVQRTQRLLSIVDRSLPKYWVKDEARMIIESADKPRDRLIMELMYQTGARVSELLMITPRDVDFHASVIRIPTLKRRKPHIRVIPIKSGLLGEIAKHIAVIKPSDTEPLFTINRTRIFQIIREACKRAGLYDKRSHPHSFRHSFAVQCVLSGVPPLVLNEWLGHANVVNTLIYTKVLATDSKQFYERVDF